jgi:transcriptional regulator with XRE-family HTH domain
MESISERLKSMRKSLNLTQCEISRQLGIAQTTYAHFEIGVKPREVYINLICEKFGVDKNWLLTGAKERGPSGADAAKIGNVRDIVLHYVDLPDSLQDLFLELFNVLSKRMPR